MLVAIDGQNSTNEYEELREELPNAAERLSMCLRGHDVPPTLVEPIHDFLSAVARLIDQGGAVADRQCACRGARPSQG